MARPKSEDRRAALLAAATKVFAEQGLSAPTSLISSTAGVSEGSLFTYFKTKDELVNVLYVELRLELADAVLAGFPRRGSVRQRFEHVWTKYVTWGVDNPLARKCMRYTHMSNAVAPASRAEAGALFAEVERLHQDAKEQRKLRDLPDRMAGQVLKAMADMTMDLIEAQPARRKEYLAVGFQLLWGALASKV
jgi:AcrR family transcriptional regulator